MRNNIVWRILVWVMSIILVGTAVFGLLLGNVRFRLFTADLYQQTLLESDVYRRSAVAVLNQNSENSDFVRALTPEQVETVALLVTPISYLGDMVSSAVDQTFAYLNQPDAPSEIYVSAAPLRTHWEQLDITESCAPFSDAVSTLCQRDLPLILDSIQSGYDAEVRIDLDEQLRPPTGTVYELVDHSGVTAIRAVVITLFVITAIGLLSSIFKLTTQFWQWLWKMLFGGGLLLALSVFALRMATAGINSNIMREQGVADDQLAVAVTDFLNEIGNQFVNGIFLQSGLLIVLAVTVWATIHHVQKEKSLT